MTDQHQHMMGEQDHPGHDERLPAPTYLHITCFADDKAALKAYAGVQRDIYANACDLSAFRLLWDERPYVAILGEAPSPELDARLRTYLATGTSARLPNDVITVLAARRQAEAERSTWMEGHYRPGLHIHRIHPDQP